MADRRRRRKVNSEVLSEGESQHHNSLTLSDSEHETDKEYIALSEYDTTDDEYNASDQNADESDEETSSRAEGSHELVDNDNENTKSHSAESDEESKRESGDGKSDNDQESKRKSQLKVLKISEDNKDDEDSPFFIPKKGNFFQHDMRSDAENQRNSRNRKFKEQIDKTRWVHDKYDEEEQTPKTREEIVEEYGYDIRSRNHRKEHSRDAIRNPRNQRKQTAGKEFSQHKSNLNMNEAKDGPEINQGSSHYRSKPKSQARHQNFEDSLPVRSQNFHATRRNYPQFTNNNYQDESSRSGNTRRIPNRTGPIKQRNPATSTNFEREASNEVKPQRNSQLNDRPAAPTDMDNVLNVINNRELQKQRPREKGYSSQRHSRRNEEKVVDDLHSLSIAENRGSAPPRRYSSLRQKTLDSPVNSPRHISPKLPPEWVKQPPHSPQSEGDLQTKTQVHKVETLQTMNNLQSDVTNIDLPTTSFEILTTENLRPSEHILSQGVLLNQQMNIPEQEHMPDHDSSALARMQWFQYGASIAYQQAMMLNQPPPALPPLLPPQPSIPASLPSTEQIGGGSVLMSDEQKVTNHQFPPISQAINQDIGNMGSLMFPPPLPQNFPPGNFMQRNILPDRNVLPPYMQMPFSQPAGLMAQEVGGATYYPPNLLQPMPSIVPVSTPVGSPMRRINTAIPIKQPME